MNKLLIFQTLTVFLSGLFKTLTVLKCQKIVLGILLALACQNSIAAKKIDAAKEDLGELKQKIESLKQELEQNQAQHKDAADALKSSETAISQANQKLRQTAEQHQQNQTKLNSLKKQSLSMNDKISAQQKQLSQLIYQQYTEGEPGYAQLILQDKNPSDIGRDLKYQSYIAGAHAKLIDEMQQSLGKVKELNAATAESLKKVADLKAKQEAERRELQAQKTEKDKVVKGLSKEIQAQRGEIIKLSRDEKSLSNLVEKLAKIAAQKPKQKPAKKPKTKPNQSKQTDEPENTVIAKNEQTPDSGDVAGSFAALKGKLKLPVRGDVTNRFGSARPDGGLTWKGLFIRASEGEDVKSIAVGRVVFADWMRGFGNLIILDHGSGYMSLYGNNQAMFKQVGDDVNPGDTIAAVGNSGGNESNGLYYELRKNSTPFNPLSWSVH